MDYKQILKDLKNQVYYPVYFLMGEEPFFIDEITSYIAENILKTEEEREFNQIVLYGKETDEETIISHAKSYSMMANYQVVIVKEAQNLKKIEKLEPYVKNPLKSTVLVLCYKYKTIDGRKSFAKTLKKNGVLFDSKPVYDNKLPDWINTYVQAKGYSIRPEATMLLAENIGNNLSRLSKEIEKLTIILDKGTPITLDAIEENIGISKDYNVFELQNALCSKDIIKAYKIIDYFAHNPKDNLLVVILAILYNYFAKILQVHSLKDKNNKREVAATLSINPFFVDRYVSGARHYPMGKLARIFSYLREADEKSKGIGITTKNDAGVLKELIYKILH